MKNHAITFLHDNVRTEAIWFGDFQLKSGRPSKYFYDLAKGMKDGQGVAAARDAYATQLMDEMHFGDVYSGARGNVFLFGPAYKGIALAGVIADKLYETHGLNVRWGYDRKELKGHGAQPGKWLVGELRDGDTVIIADDVITTAETKIRAWNDLSAAREGLTHGGIIVALNRQETTLGGRSPVAVLGEQDINVSSIMLAREVFGYLHGREIGDKVLVDDQAYADFQAHQGEFGIPDE